MRSRWFVTLVGVTGFAAAGALAADALVRAGRWEVTVQMGLEGRNLPTGFPGMEPMKSIACLTEDEIQKSQSPIPLPQNGQCTVSDYRMTGKDVTFTMRCDDATMKLAATVHSPDSYSGTFTTQGEDPSKVFVVRFSGKRVGDACSAKELAEDAADDA
jgi:uncharacterized protein DUF3617